MKRFLALILMLVLLLSACAPSVADNGMLDYGDPKVDPTPTPTPSPTPSPTPAPTYMNPLNGEILDEPFTNRIFASTISNIPASLPHVSMNEADIVMEMFVNNSVIRCLALFSDISDLEAFGSVRSTRLMFNDIAQHYNTILLHSGGSGTCINDAENRGLDAFNIDQWALREAGCSYRDKKYSRGYEHSLFGIGQGIIDYMAANNIPLTESTDKEYYLNFIEDGTPANGEAATQINMIFKYNGSSKETIMKYDEELGKYVFYQYTKMMKDQITDEPEAFENVIVMDTNISLNGRYQVADFVAGGDGYFACGGKLIPITWSCDSETSPFRYMTTDGQPLNLGVGNTYIAVIPVGSPVTWTAE